MAAISKGFDIEKKSKTKPVKLKNTAITDKDVIDPEFEHNKNDSNVLSDDDFSKNFQEHMKVEAKDLNVVVENSNLELENENGDNKTYVSKDGCEGQLKSGQFTDQRRLFYGIFYGDPKVQEDKVWNTQESWSAVSGMNVPELVRKAEMGDLVLDDRGLSKLKERFISMHKMYKRQFYLCGERYIIPEQILSWSEDCHKSELKSHGTDRLPGDDTLNRKVALMHGDIVSLEVDVVVNSISSNVTGEHEGVSKGIIRAATTLVKYELVVWRTVRVINADLALS